MFFHYSTPVEENLDQLYCNLTFEAFLLGGGGWKRNLQKKDTQKQEYQSVSETCIKGRL